MGLSMSKPSSAAFKLGKFRKDEKTFVGKVVGDRVLETDAEHVITVMENGVVPNGVEHDLSELKMLAPVDRPSKIVCIGLNYRSHITEMHAEIPRNPLIFMKPSSSIVGPGDDIVLPRMSSRVDYEGESAIVIGRRASHSRHGSEHIFGFTCFNDVTARDLQKTDPDWTRAKGFDTFAPIGPFISSLRPTRVKTVLNGKTVQESPLDDRVYDDAHLVEYISSIMALEPGDVIATGTPSGIAPMKRGDIVEVELDGVGRLRNKVV
jgi:2-keto-4-pentenoate hydratase/2-oxohepta-3-ene-1,7-dioic acid hydratase in catechol pathway